MQQRVKHRKVVLIERAIKISPAGTYISYIIYARLPLRRVPVFLSRTILEGKCSRFVCSFSEPYIYS